MGYKTKKFICNRQQTLRILVLVMGCWTLGSMQTNAREMDSATVLKPKVYCFEQKAFTHKTGDYKNHRIYDSIFLDGKLINILRYTYNTSYFEVFSSASVNGKEAVYKGELLYMTLFDTGGDSIHILPFNTKDEDCDIKKDRLTGSTIIQDEEISTFEYSSPFAHNLAEAPSFFPDGEWANLSFLQSSGPAYIQYKTTRTAGKPGRTVNFYDLPSPDLQLTSFFASGPLKEKSIREDKGEWKVRYTNQMCTEVRHNGHYKAGTYEDRNLLYKEANGVPYLFSYKSFVPFKKEEMEGYFFRSDSLQPGSFTEGYYRKNKKEGKWYVKTGKDAYEIVYRAGKLISKKEVELSSPAYLKKELPPELL